jgi:hypothetical protein
MGNFGKLRTTTFNNIKQIATYDGTHNTHFDKELSTPIVAISLMQHKVENFKKPRIT